MSATSSLTSGVASRYATAVFELAKDAKKLPAVQADMTALSDALGESGDFVELISSPIYTRDEQAAAVSAIAKKMKLDTVTTNALKLMAGKRRLNELPGVIAGVRALVAEENGEVTAEVTTAKALTKTQETKLAAALKKSVGKDVIINATVNENIIGGLIVKVGSKMIDSSIASKLSNLQNAMKEVG